MNQGFTDLDVWQKSRELVVEIYRATATFPSEEKFGLTSQIRRATVSIGSNIAEGSARGTDKDFARFLLIALGSAAEVKAQLIFATDLNFLPEETCQPLLERIHQIARMLKGLRRSILAKKEEYST